MKIKLEFDITDDFNEYLPKQADLLTLLKKVCLWEMTELLGEKGKTEKVKYRKEKGRNTD